MDGGAVTEHEEVCKGCWEMEHAMKLAKENEKLADEGKDVARGCAWSRMNLRGCRSCVARERQHLSSRFRRSSSSRRSTG